MTLGYRPEPKLYKLTFEDHPGLEVVMTSLNIDALMKLTAAADNVTTGGLPAVTEMFERFARCLQSWNVDDDAGVPVPATYEGVITQDADFITGIIQAWQEAIAGVAPPLPHGSNGGGTSPDPSLALASSSQSLPS